MPAGEFKVYFLDAEVPQRDLDTRDNLVAVEALMRANHREGAPVYCGCSEARPRLAVVLGDRYFLRRYPGTADLHHTDCMFAATICSPIRARKLSGVERNDDGTLTLHATEVYPLR